MRTIIAITSLFVILLSHSIFAGHYYLEDIDLFDAAVQKKLIANGITSTKALLEKVLKNDDRKALAKTLEVPKSEVDKWAGMCDLLRINGVGPKVVKLFLGAKVYNIKQLRTQDPTALLSKINEVNAKEKITEKTLDVELLTDWIKQANQIDLIVEY